jgi:hypothetical protein
MKAAVGGVALTVVAALFISNSRPHHAIRENDGTMDYARSDVCFSYFMLTTLVYRQGG